MPFLATAPPGGHVSSSSSRSPSPSPPSSTTSKSSSSLMALVDAASFRLDQQQREKQQKEESRSLEMTRNHNNNNNSGACRYKSWMMQSQSSSSSSVSPTTVMLSSSSLSASPFLTSTSPPPPHKIVPSTSKKSKTTTNTTTTTMNRLGFMETLRVALEDDSIPVLQWMPDGTSFTITDTKRFAMMELSRLFHLQNMSSFLRKLTQLGFDRIMDKATMNFDIFRHAKLVRGTAATAAAAAVGGTVASKKSASTKSVVAKSLKAMVGGPLPPMPSLPKMMPKKRWSSSFKSSLQPSPDATTTTAMTHTTAKTTSKQPLLGYRRGRHSTLVEAGPKSKPLPESSSNMATCSLEGLPDVPLPSSTKTMVSHEQTLPVSSTARVNEGSPDDILWTMMMDKVPPSRHRQQQRWYSHDLASPDETQWCRERDYYIMAQHHHQPLRLGNYYHNHQHHHDCTTPHQDYHQHQHQHQQFVHQLLREREQQLMQGMDRISATLSHAGQQRH